MTKKNDKPSTAENDTGAAGRLQPAGSILEFNINDYVRVKLTDIGRAALKKDYEDRQRRYGRKPPYDYVPPKEDSEGWSKWQLWMLMQEIGPHIGIGVHIAIETTIKIEV